MASCSICPESDAISLVSCTQQHFFCKSCLSNYILQTKQGVLPAKCPVLQCTGQWTLNELIQNKVLQGEALIRVEKVRREREALSSGRGFWCATQTCSELLIAPTNGVAFIDPVLECTSCNLLHCWQCQCEWHDGLFCDEYQCLPDEAKRDMKRTGEISLKSLVATNHWHSCEQCHAVVEKIEGCNHMYCVCRYEFCYRCGSKWAGTGNTCSKNPPCPLFDDIPEPQTRHRNLNLGLENLSNMYRRGLIRDYSGLPHFLVALVNGTCPYCNRGNFARFIDLERHLDTTQQHEVRVNANGHLY